MEGSTKSESVLDEILRVIEFEWYESTKEALSENHAFSGLLDYRLFADKVPSYYLSVALAKSFKMNGSALNWSNEININ